MLPSTSCSFVNRNPTLSGLVFFFLFRYSLCFYNIIQSALPHNLCTYTLTRETSASDVLTRERKPGQCPSPATSSYMASYRTRCSRRSDRTFLMLSSDTGLSNTPSRPKLIHLSFVDLSVLPVSATSSGLWWRFVNFSCIRRAIW